MTVMTQSDRISLVKHNLTRALAAIAAARFEDGFTYLKEMEVQSAELRQNLADIITMSKENPT